MEEMGDRRDVADTSLSQRLKQFEIEKNSRRTPEESADLDDFQPRDRVPLLQRYPPPKTTIAAVLLTIGGIVFISLGLSILYSHLLSHGKDRGLALLILGCIMFLPGSYASYIIYASWNGWDGYDYTMLPSYDDD